jgi:hypothetical protein
MAEEIFEKLAIQKNLKVIKATKKQQISHIDFILVHSSGAKYMIDVKARKKSARNNGIISDDLIWIEFKNVAGLKGWLYGAADYIAFEREDDFVIVSRANLVLLCERIVSKSKVTNPKDALYKIYTRTDRKDEISLITMKDILDNTKTTVWKKSQQT